MKTLESGLYLLGVLLATVIFVSQGPQTPINSKLLGGLPCNMSASSQEACQPILRADKNTCNALPKVWSAGLDYGVTPTQRWDAVQIIDPNGNMTGYQTTCSKLRETIDDKGNKIFIDVCIPLIKYKRTTPCGE